MENFNSPLSEPAKSSQSTLDDQQEAPISYEDSWKFSVSSSAISGERPQTWTWLIHQRQKRAHYFTVETKFLLATC